MMKKGITFIDVLIGTSLILIVFLGIFGAYQLGLKVVGQSKNKIIATAIASGEIEKIRNLPYESIGIKGSFPDGILENSTTTIQNNIEFKIERRIDYVVDPVDGIALPEDDCPNDYKKVEIKISWQGRFGGKVELSTDIAPKNLIQECETLGGILSVSVFDALGVMVPSPLIEIKDPTTDQTIKVAMPIEGKHYFSLATSTYKVVVSKDGYSSERTYGTNEVATPEKPHPLVLEGELIETSFSIDKLSSFSVNTLSLWGSESFADTFLDESKISEKSNLIITDGKVSLVTSTEGYFLSGYLISVAVSPINLIKWDKLSFSDSEPENTDFKCQIYYASGTEWMFVPDVDLPGNSEGFDISPVDLSDLSTTTYSQLKIRGDFSTNSTTTTPILYDWQLSWKTSQPTPIPNVTFNLRGAKIIGTDADEKPVYKYSQNRTSNSSGYIAISNLEWDSYTFSVDPVINLDLVETQPSPQPIALSPDTNVSVKLYLKAENSLLLTVQNGTTLQPIFSAAARLYNAATGYDKTQHTDEKGQTYFIPLESATYNLEVQAPGYLVASTTLLISGDKTKIINLEQVE